MSRKEYNGLTFKFVPIKGTDIVAQSTCDIISVQYYITEGEFGFGTCTTEEGDNTPDEGYSYNWNRQPNFD